MRHIILGAGPAGVIAAETIRKHAPNDEIYLVGDEPEAPYSRMAIPYLLIGKVDESGTHLRHEVDHFGRQHITLMRARALGVDIERRVVTLHDGSEEAFDRLLIATGSSPTITISSCGACLRKVSAAMTPAGPAPRMTCFMADVLVENEDSAPRRCLDGPQEPGYRPSFSRVAAVRRPSLSQPRAA